MRQSRWLCFQWKPEKDVIDSEISYQEGYDRLDCSDDADGDYCESNNNICQSEKQETEAHKLKESSPYSKKDHKDKKLSRKLRRKEKRDHLVHLLHVTWKWCKRGFMATAPRLSATFNLAPSPGPVVYNIQRVQAGGTAVYV
ncbi:hypothetical protein RRG08_046112 [Elysia crispata]|uniref:Uncharacterized protein n=1 Tax=Elysia crispata TaxID=231223 RepID=A0AAE0YHA5_9GAST|nr:hypothetical protein RRG08_046112 [Elysia crispata]